MGILVAALITVFVFGFVVYQVSKLPQYQQMQQCSINTITLKSAIDRYKIRHNGTYPANLKQLTPFLTQKDRQSLYCPLDKNHTEPSYQYKQLAADSSADTVLLSCDRHNITVMKQTTPIRVYITVGGRGGIKRLDSRQTSIP
ncbi:MAG: hypothetical protein ACYC1M_13270 [Armatimonadota bacterium]